MTKTEYGIQMYSVRDSAEKSMKETLREISEMGYHYIEFAGFFGHSAEEIKAWLDEYGLECSGTHTKIELLTPEKIDDAIAYHKTIGCETLIVPGCDWSTPEKCGKVLEALAYAEKKLAENGIKLAYHNHSHEFLPTEDGIVFEDELLEKTDIALEIDTFWLFNAGLDVLGYLEAHKDRIAVIHLKDGIPCAAENHVFGKAHTDVKGLSLGLGEAPVKAVHDWAVSNGVRMVVESEGLNPTGLEEIRRCIDYLHTL